jgi:glutamine synthetase
MFGYSLLRMNQNQGFFNALMDEMLAFNVPIEGLHTETGPGVYEVAIGFSDGAGAGRPRHPVQDRRPRDRQALRHHAQLHGQVEPAVPGCSGHIHQSLSDGKNNLFYDAKNPRKMSKLFESYLAGQVACMMEFGPMIWPTINSYKRLVDGFWAPVKPTWGMDNRTASFRVIAGSAPRPPGWRPAARAPTSTPTWRWRR